MAAAIVRRLSQARCEQQTDRKQEKQQANRSPKSR
jgi:hypothetical protein